MIEGPVVVFSKIYNHGGRKVFIMIIPAALIPYFTVGLLGASKIRIKKQQKTKSLKPLEKVA